MNTTLSITRTLDSILRLHEAGILDYISRRTSPTNGGCGDVSEKRVNTNVKKKNQQLTMKDLRAVFFIQITGVIISIGAFLVEVFRYKKKTTKMSPLVWNSLPLSIRRSKSLHEFLSALKTHLFCTAYELR